MRGGRSGGPPQGLRYEALGRDLARARHSPQKHRRRVFADLRVMEIAAWRLCIMATETKTSSQPSTNTKAAIAWRNPG